VTQTSPQPTDRLSSRQRRIDEQRRKIESARGQQRRKRLTWLAAIIVVVALAVVVLVLMIPRGASASQMRQVTTETATHVDEGAPLTYSHRPPSSGMHYGTLPSRRSTACTTRR